MVSMRLLTIMGWVLMSLACLNGSPVENEDDKVLQSRMEECRMLQDQNMIFHCMAREVKKHEIKRELSTMLPVRPMGKNNISIPESHLKKMLLKEGFAEDGSFEVDNEQAHAATRIIPVVQAPPHLPANTFRSWFSMNSVPVKSVKDATLYFYVKGITPRHGFVRYNVHIYRFRSVDEVDVDPIWSYKRNREMPESGDWDSVEVSDLVKEWGSQPEKNYGMMVKVEPEDPGYSSDFDAIERSGNMTAMFLELRMSSEQSRARRSLPISAGSSYNYTCTAEPNHPDAACCRYQLQVDFGDFGWDWIIAPKRYNAYYCAGKCKLGQHIKGSQHALFMEQKNVHNMCCSPEKLSEMKIIYMDENGSLQIRMISNMIVQKCGCS